MRRERNPNLQILEMVAERLGSLADDMVLVGGCATGLLLTDAAAPPIRATQDVDVITEVASLQDYHRLSGQLRKRGFKEDQRPDAHICGAVGTTSLVGNAALTQPTIKRVFVPAAPTSARRCWKTMGGRLPRSDRRRTMNLFSLLLEPDHAFPVATLS